MTERVHAAVATTLPHEALPWRARVRVALAASSVGRALVEGPIRYFHATLENKERIPQHGGALLVGNHAMMGIDGVVLGALVHRELGRQVRFLGEKNLWKIPVVRDVLTALGAVPGEPARAVAMLTNGELVGVYPGGIDDSWKPASERHRLQWRSRAGFARVAMRAGVPIVPIAGVGIDDMYTVVGRERWLGRRIFVSPRYDFPLVYGRFGSLIPRRAPQKFVALEPIDTRGDVNDDADVERIRKATFDALEVALRNG